MRNLSGAIILVHRISGNQSPACLDRAEGCRYDGTSAGEKVLLQRNHLQRFTIGGLCAAGVLCLLPLSAAAAPYFEDGFLGLTQTELHEKMGMPQAVRDRKSALRVFTYYAITDWDKYFRKLVSPENGEDVYTFKRDGIEVRYSFSYAVDPNDQSENRTLYVRLVDIEFSPAVPISQVPALVPEFKPPTDPASPAFRSNIWVLLFKGPASPQARFIVKEAAKDSLDWTLAYQLFSLQGLPDPLTIKSPIDRMEISTQSIELVRRRQKHTHEAMMNPYSSEFSLQPTAPKPSQAIKTIPVPKYAE
jgi:hypothetical protein